MPCDRVLSGGRLYSQVTEERSKELLKRKDLKMVEFKTKDGLSLSAYFISRNKVKANLLLCHAYRGTKESMSHFIDMFSEFNILLFDFRAHGKSHGRLITFGCHEYKDVIAAAEFLSNNSAGSNNAFKKRLPLIILGCSMGGAAAIKALEIEPNLCDALVTDSSFSSLSDVIYNAFSAVVGLPCYPFVPVLCKILNFVAKCDVNQMLPIKSVKKINKPIFYIHSCVDRIVDPNDSILMYANSLNKKAKLWIAPECKHPSISKKYFDLYKKKVYKFLKKII